MIIGSPYRHSKFEEAAIIIVVIHPTRKIDTMILMVETVDMHRIGMVVTIQQGLTKTTTDTATMTTETTEILTR